MEILVSIDDTDNLDSRGTGELAVDLTRLIEDSNWGRCSFISRHQLLVHPDIPYTSHNSSMCFSAQVCDAAVIGQFIDSAAEFLIREAAPGSDPGLCVAKLSDSLDQQRLIKFGSLAKQHVLCKEDAYGLAKKQGIHLSEHGGSGQGVIGALAGVGLRLGGNDGRLKGWLNFSCRQEVLSVAELCAHPYVDRVQQMNGTSIAMEEKVFIRERPKTVLIDGQLVLLVNAGAGNGKGAGWETCHRRQLKIY